LQIEHIVAQQHFGRTTAENLALACQQCNLFKGPNLASVDPQTGEIVLLYHPRRDRWQEHFELSNSFILGLSPAGRATAQLLNFNSVKRRRLRARLLRLGEIVPPP
jgi:hypothetical protein